MNKTIRISGKFISQYKMDKTYINDFNKIYEKAKNSLESYAPRLAGRLESELNIVNLIEKTKGFKFITDCMKDHMHSSIKFGLLPPGPSHLNILSCWVNDMTEGEYNPPHTHHNGTGWSTVLFLKIPPYINDAKEPHKFRDGKLGFMMQETEGEGSHYLDPEVGDFYIFNANHQHFVMPFKTKKPKEIRRSISFNFIKEKKND